MKGRIVIAGSAQGNLYVACFIVQGFTQPIDIFAHGASQEEAMGSLLRQLIPAYKFITITSIEYEEC